MAKTLLYTKLILYHFTSLVKTVILKDEREMKQAQPMFFGQATSRWVIMTLLFERHRVIRHRT